MEDVLYLRSTIEFDGETVETSVASFGVTSPEDYSIVGWTSSAVGTIDSVAQSFDLIGTFVSLDEYGRSTLGANLLVPVLPDGESYIYTLTAIAVPRRARVVDTPNNYAGNS